MEETPVTYTDFVTDHGTIRIIHEVTLGEMSLFVLLSLILIFVVFQWIINKIWE